MPGAAKRGAALAGQTLLLLISQPRSSCSLGIL